MSRVNSVGVATDEGVHAEHSDATCRHRSSYRGPADRRMGKRESQFCSDVFSQLCNDKRTVSIIALPRSYRRTANLNWIWFHSLLLLLLVVLLPVQGGN